MQFLSMIVVCTLGVDNPGPDDCRAYFAAKFSPSVEECRATIEEAYPSFDQWNIVEEKCVKLDYFK